MLLNPAGWAPCQRVRHGDTTFFLLPGPPSEMQAVFDRYLRDHFGGADAGQSLARRVYVNMWESDVAPLARQVMDAVPGTYIKGYIALGNQGRLPLDVVVRGANPHEVSRISSRLSRCSRGAGRGERASTNWLSGGRGAPGHPSATPPGLRRSR